MRELTFGSFTEALRHAYVDLGISVDIDLIDDSAGSADREEPHAIAPSAVIRYPDRPRPGELSRVPEELAHR